MTGPESPEQPAPFDPREPVAEGITVLEASAGTGKTHAVASLVVAEVAEGRPLDELLVVTFTRKATGALRERVWQRLTGAAAALAAGDAACGDELIDHLGAGDPSEVGTRRRRLERALSDFDAATIATTHGFCQQVLTGLGVAGDAEADVVLVEDIDDLLRDAVDDLFVRRFHAGGAVLFNRAEAWQIARAVVGNPDCRLAPVDDNPADRLRRDFANTVRRRIADHKRRNRIITYDDLLTRLDHSLADPHRGAIVADRLRRRFTMAVVDEFQDTDTVQWRILQAAFGAPPSRLVLVGDPKQAIYAFRGGDVHAYLDATAEARRRRSLPVNWRADKPLIDAVDALLAGAQLGHPTIRHRAMQARPGAEGWALSGAAARAPLHVRLARRTSERFHLTQGGAAEKRSVRRFIAADLAAEAVRLLGTGTTIDGRPVVPGDVAVLVRTRWDAQAVQECLSAAGVPAVAHGTSAVYGTGAARAWLELLRALERPSSDGRVSTMACGPFVGWDAARLASATDRDREWLDDLLRDWAGALATRSVAGLVRRIEAATGLAARLGGRSDGERLLSDLRHVAELLHGRQTTHPGSVTGLARWLAEQVAAPGDLAPEAARRRLESDADAVAIHTIHNAKGLEFPIVLLPSVWEAPRHDSSGPVVFHDESGGRCISVGAHGPHRQRQQERAAQEADQEDLRLLYVALTRARHMVVAWWASGHDAGRSAFARVLLGRGSDGAVADTVPGPPSEDEVGRALAAVGIPTVDAADPPPGRYQPVRPAPVTLEARQFARRFDGHWTRTSYTGLTRAAHNRAQHVRPGSASAAEDGLGRGGRGGLDGLDEFDGGFDGGDPVESIDVPGVTEPVEADEGAIADEPAVVASPGAPPTVDDLPDAVLPLGGLPGGARFGTLVHGVMERADFTAADLEAELRRACTDVGARRLLGDDVDVLAAGLALAIETPLGPALAGARLRDLARSDRRDEMSFELPLAGGDRPEGALVGTDAVADVFAGLPDDDPFAGYSERLRDPLLAAAVRGFLTGSIDLVARFGDRYVVVDYKTNQLAPHGQPATAWHYRREALAQVMADAHYPLQAAFYAVALHRFLRWRLPGYRPDRHLGGAAYLFLRGMTGAAGAPAARGDEPCGVFVWRPPAGFVVELSDLLDRGRPPRIESTSNRRKAAP